MRKWVVIFFAVCLLTAIGSAVAFVDFRAQTKDIRVTTIGESGDPAYADSLVFETLCSLEQVRWQTESTWKHGEMTTVTDCTSYGTPVVFLPSYFRTQNEVLVYEQLQNVEYWWNTMVLPRKCGNSGKVSLREISPYYNLNVSYWLGYAYVVDLNTTEYLKIKTLDEEKVLLYRNSYWVRDDNSGEVNECYDIWYETRQGEDYYEPEIWSAWSDTAIYLVINNRSAGGQVMDFSDTPGGYGIWKIPCFPAMGEACIEKTLEGVEYFSNYRYGEIEQFLPLDTEKNVRSLTMDENMNNLFLLSETDGVYEVTVIDIHSAKVLAEVSLGKLDATEYSSFYSFSGADFGAVYESETRCLYLVREKTAGEWTMERIQMQEDNPFDTAFRNRTYLRMACDGERLAVVCRVPDQIVYKEYVETSVWIFADGEQKYKTTFYTSFDELDYYYANGVDDKVKMQDFRIRFAE